MPKKVYQFTNKKTGEVVNIPWDADNPPSPEDVQKFKTTQDNNARAKLPPQGILRNLQFATANDLTDKELAPVSKLADALYSPSDVFARKAKTIPGKEQGGTLPQRVEKKGAELVGGLLEPENLAMGALAATGPGAFAVPSFYASKIAPQMPALVKKHLENPTFESGADLVLNATMLGLMGKGAAEGAKGAIPPLRPGTVTSPGSPNGPNPNRGLPRGPAMEPPRLQRALPQGNDTIAHQDIHGNPIDEPIDVPYTVKPPLAQEPVAQEPIVTTPPTEEPTSDITVMPNTVGPPQVTRGSGQIESGEGFTMRPSDIESPDSRVRQGVSDQGLPDRNEQTVTPTTIGPPEEPIKAITVQPPTEQALVDNAYETDREIDKPENVERLNKRTGDRLVNKLPPAPEQAAELQKTTPLTNPWLRNQSIEALEQMRKGAKGVLSHEIDTVLGERGAGPSQSLTVEAPKTESLTVQSPIKGRLKEAQNRVKSKVEEPADETSNDDEYMSRLARHQIDSRTEIPKKVELRKTVRMAQELGRSSDDALNDLIDSNIPPAKAEAIVKGVYEEPDVSYAEVIINGEKRIHANTSPRLIKVLGQNLYSGSIGQIVLKEAIQNAFDSVRGVPNPRIDANIHPESNTLEINDNGTGMLPEVVSKEFVEPGESLKPEDASGGYGIAKVALFHNAKSIYMSTVARDANGNLVRTTVTGSGEDWADKDKGLSISVDSYVPDGTSTGTKLKIELNKDLGYGIHAFKDKLLRSTGTGIQLNFKHSGKYEDNDVKSNLDPANKIPMDKITTFKVPGSDIDINASQEHWRKGYSVHVEVLNKGLYQFDLEVPIGNNQLTLPKVIQVDVKSNTNPESPDYPFRPDRQGLRNGIDERIKDYIQKNLIDDAAKREGNKLKNAVNNAPKIVGTKFRVIDTDDVLPKDLVVKIGNHPDMRDFIFNSDMAFNQLKDKIAKLTGSKDVPNVVLEGIGLGKSYLGVNIKGDFLKNPKFVDDGRSRIELKQQVNNIVLLNPHVILSEVDRMVDNGYIKENETVKQFSKNVIATIVHEITHQQSRGHEEEFAGAITRNMSHAAEDIYNLSNLLSGSIKDNFLELLRDQHDAIKSHGEGENIFGQISSESSTGPTSGRDQSNATNGEEGGTESTEDVSNRSGSEAGRLGGASQLQDDYPLASKYPNQRGSFSLKPKQTTQRLKKSLKEGGEPTYEDIKKDSNDLKYTISAWTDPLPTAIKKFSNGSPAGDELARLVQVERTERNRLNGLYSDHLIKNGLSSDRRMGPNNITDAEYGNPLVRDNKTGKVITVIQGNTSGSNEGKLITYGSDGSINAAPGYTLLPSMPGNLIDVVENNTMPANPRIAKAASAVKKVLDELGRRAEQSGAGMRIGESGTIPFKKMDSGYMPHKFTEQFFDSLEKDPTDNEAILQSIVNQAKARGETITKGEAQAYIRNSRKLGEIFSAPQHARLSQYNGYIKDRSALFNHIKELSGRIGTAETLGPKDVNGPLINDLITKIEKDGGDPKYIRSFVNRIVGRDDTGLFRSAENGVYRAMSSIMTAKYLPLFAISDLATVGNLYMRGSMKRVIPALWRNLTVQDRMRNNIMPTGALSEHLTDDLAPESLFGKLYKIREVESFLRGAAADVGRGTAKDLVEYLKAKSGDPTGYGYKTAYGRLKNMLLKNDLQMHQLLERGKLSNQETNFAGGRFAEMTQGLVDPVDMPYQWTNKNGGLIMDFVFTYKRFAYQSSRLLVDSIRENPAKTIPLLLTMAPVIGEVLADSKAALKGALASVFTDETAADAVIREIEMRSIPKTNFTKNHPYVSRYLADIAQSWSLGLMADVLGAADEGESGLSTFATGPMFSTAGEVASLVANVWKDLLHEPGINWDQMEKDFTKFAGEQIPGSFASAIKRSQKSQKGPTVNGPVIQPIRVQAPSR